MLQSNIFDAIPTLAFRHPLVGAPAVGFHGGPVIEAPEWQALRHTRYHAPVDWFDGAEAVSQPLAGDYVYVGPVYDHFGHVMSEMVHRLLPAAAAFPGRRLLLVSTLGDQRFTGFDSFPGFYRDVLRFFAVDPCQVVVLNQDRVVQQLHICQQGSDFGGGPHPGYLEGLRGFSDRLIGPPTASPEKVYVSRSALPGGGGFLGERYVEQVLQQQGFHVARPEAMPLIEQMRLYRQAKLVVFPEGSACHGVELLGAGAMETVVFLARRLDHQEIFRRVLAPRSQEYVVLQPPEGTGSIMHTKQHNTVGLIDFAALFGLLQARGFVGAMQFDVNRYVDECAADFDRHVAHFMAADAGEVDPDLVRAKSGAFAAIFQRLREAAG